MFNIIAVLVTKLKKSLCWQTSKENKNEQKKHFPMERFWCVNYKTLVKSIKKSNLFEKMNDILVSSKKINGEKLPTNKTKEQFHDEEIQQKTLTATLKKT